MPYPLRTFAHSRRRVRRILPTIVVGVSFAVLAACGSNTTSAAGAPSISGGSELDAVIPAQIANMAFVDQDGKTVHLSDFKGKNVVIQDGMTLCQEQCPIDTATFVSMAREYAATAKSPSDTVFLTVTVDPKRDVPAQISAYRQLYAPRNGALSQWQMLTGSEQNIAALWKYLHVWYQKVPQDAVVHNWRTGALLTYDVQHDDDVFFIDGSLQQKYLINGMPSLGGKIPSKIEHFMSAEGMENMKMSNWTVAQGLSVLNWMNGQ